MLKNSLILVLQQKKQIQNSMTKVQIKSEKLTPFWIFFTMIEQIDTGIAQTMSRETGQ